MPSSNKRNARHEIRQTLAAKPAKVHDSRTGKVTTKALALKDEPGHRDLGLIPKPVKGIVVMPDKPKGRGAFSGVNRNERARRQAEREAASVSAA